MKTTPETPGKRFGEVLDFLKRKRAIRAYLDILDGLPYRSSTISEIKADRQLPNEDILQTLQTRFGISSDWIMKKEGEMELATNKPSKLGPLPLIPDLEGERDRVREHIKADNEYYRTAKDYDEGEFDRIVNRHYAKFAAMDQNLSKEQKFAYRHLYNNVAPETMWLYVLSQLDK